MKRGEARGVTSAGTLNAERFQTEGLCEALERARMIFGCDRSRGIKSLASVTAVVVVVVVVVVASVAVEIKM